MSNLYPVDFSFSEMKMITNESAVFFYINLNLKTLSMFD